MDSTKTFDFVSQVYDDSIIPTLVDYIKIPNQSPAYDPEWATNGLMDKALDLMVAWVRAQNVQGLTLEVLREAGRTPLVFMEIPGTVQNKDLTVLLYGHMDKQPPFEGWSEGLGPYKPVIKDGKLYGRGGADDGYAIFSSVLAIKACREQNIPHARCVVLIEACEESGSLDLEHYVGLLAPRIGTPSLIVCLDSGAGNYEQMWMTTSLRGIVAGNLRVQILNEGVHSGDASGIVPSSFRIARQLISRLENENTGEIIPRDFYVDIPKQRVEQAQVVADILKDEVWDKYPYVAGAGPVHKNRAELVLNRTWRPALSTVGAHGFPPLQIAGNVLRPETAFKLSLRIPPRLDPAKATEALRQLLEANPPYGARVVFEAEKEAPGWDAPALADWLAKATHDACTAFFNKPPCYMGEGGSIPFMGMLGAKFPQAQFVITGVLGPMSNAHGPNEFLEINFTKRITSCVAHILADFTRVHA
eukprot:Opistho-1_new@60270